MAPQSSKLLRKVIPSDGRVEPRGELLNFSVYFLSGLSINGVSKLLNAKRVKEDKIGAAANQQENVEMASISNAAVGTNKASSLIKDAALVNQKQKAVEVCRERSEGSNDDQYKGKKPRVTWTNEMHQKFLDAIEKLGYDKAVPKKIVEVMGVPGLTRENVASHLQKYRCSMRRTQETIFGSLPCIRTRTELGGFGALTSPSTSKDLVFCSRSEGKFSHLSDVRNMMQRRDKHFTSSSDNSGTSKFVGYRFIGNQIDYGPINKSNTDAVFSTTGRWEHQPTSYVQHHHPFPDQNTNVTAGCILQQSSLLSSSASRIHGAETAGIDTSQEPDLLSSYALQNESLLEGPPTQQPQQISDQKSGDCRESLLHQLQSWDTSANAAPHQDLSLPPLEAPGNGFSDQAPAGFFDDILQQHCSPSPQNLDDIFGQGGNDDYLINGTGNTYDQFDIQEFDDTLFSQDD
ncbi:uncharacterized protein LOC130999196 isoform X2 [Salvia miltiorrhiza]|uniref:uncharacterized protein LOC130999196 isoform X2 n=1 Tax=Salvia miltiorrhiza TaxID=226208 RepID=UPI0025AB9227|nr:uncharacterized protein LOC130999196 isoform X2 [Salvia miltiorrhiza]